MIAGLKTSLEETACAQPEGPRAVTPLQEQEIMLGMPVAQPVTQPDGDVTDGFAEIITQAMGEAQAMREADPFLSPL
jgi:hypothetical protein